MNDDLKKNFHLAQKIIEQCHDETDFHECLEKKYKDLDPKVREIIERL